MQYWGVGFVVLLGQWVGCLFAVHCLARVRVLLLV